jgi:hypothetical protein
MGIFSRTRGADGRPRRLLGRAGLALLLTAGGGVALAAAVGQAVVGVSELQIRASKTGFGGSVAVVKQNDRLEVLADEGDWLKVRTPAGKEGYVKRAALSARSIQPAKIELAGDAGSSGAGASLATKGLEPSAIEYARGKSLRTDGVRKMITIHESITPEEFEQFEKDGRVGSAKGL